MTWPVLLVISIICMSTVALLQRQLLKDARHSAATLTIITQFLAGVVVLVFALGRGFELDLGQIPLFNLLLSVVVYSIGSQLRFMALSRVSAAHFIIVFTSRALWTVLIATLFLGDGLSIQGLIGALLIAGAILVAYYDGKQLTLNRGLVLSLAAAMAIGVGFGNDSYVYRGDVDVPSYSSFLFIATSVLIALVQPSSVREIPRVMKDVVVRTRILLLVGVYATGPVAFFSAVQVGGNVSVLAALNQLQTIVVVIAGFYLLHERERLKQKYLGALLSLVGAVLIVS